METKIISFKNKKIKNVPSTPVTTAGKPQFYQISPFTSGTHVNNVINIDHPQALNITEPPEKIEITYYDDSNILSIHQAIFAKFSAELKNLDNVKNQVNEIELELKNNIFSKVDTFAKLNVIKKLKSEIDDLESGKKWDKYITQAKPILEQYLPLSGDEAKGIFRLKKNVTPDFTEEQVKQRLIIIDDYLQIAKDYIEIDVSWKGKNEARCPACDCKFSEVYIDDESGLHKCNCGYERENLSKVAGFNDPKRVNVGGRNNYNDEETFIKAFYRIQGKIIDNIPEALYRQLDDFFKLKGLPTGDEIKNYPILPNGKKEGTSIQQLFIALEHTNNASYYNNANLIAHNYWGWNLPDYSIYEEGILEDYYKTQKVYDNIKTRDSNLNVIIRIFLHLKARDCPCVWEDFKILSSRESLEYHREMWIKMCKSTGIKYYELI